MLFDLGISWHTYIFVCLMVGVGGFVDASAGGGGLITLPVYAVTGLPMHTIYAANKFSAASGTTVASVMFLRKGALEWKVALTAAATSFAGSFCGSQLVLVLSDAVLKAMVLIMIPLAAAVVFLQRKRSDEDRSSEISTNKKMLLAALIGLIIGSYDGLVGPGTGTFAIIAFIAVMKYDMRKASGNAKILNLASNYASLVTYISAGKVPFALAVPCGICNICGALLGSHFALSKGAKFIRPMMLVVMVILLVKMATELII